MNPPHRDIKFTTTDDGVGIAYWEIGSGMPLVIANSPALSHAELEWTVPSMASLYVELARRYRVIRFDPRGVGLSETPTGWGMNSSDTEATYSARDVGLDMTAVVAASGIDRYALVAVGTMGPIAIAHAADHPGSVTALILCDSMANIGTSSMSVGIRSVIALLQVESESGTEIPTTMWEATFSADEINAGLNLIRAATKRPRENGWMVAGLLAQLEWDAERRLRDVRSPTLVLTARNGWLDSLPDGRRLAAGIAGAQLRVVDGTYTPYFADHAAILTAIDTLLQPETISVDPAPVLSGFRTVVFTDIVESTEFVRGVGDENGRAAIRHLEDQVTELANKHGGRVVKNLGDGSLISFGSNTAALTFALGLQDQVGDGPLQLRVGMAAGEPIQEDGDIHGAVVAQASRIADLGGAGEIIVADSVRQLALGKGFSFEPAGEVTLKGFDEPITVWKVRP